MLSLIIVGMLVILIPNNFVEHNKTSTTKENIFRSGNTTILSITYNNKTIYYYDNNLTEIPVSQLQNINFVAIPFNANSNYMYYQFQITGNIPLSEINKIYGFNASIEIYLVPKFTTIFNNNTLLAIFPIDIGIASITIDNPSGYYNNFEYGITENFVPNYVFNRTSLTSTGYEYKPIFVNNLYENPQSINNVQNASLNNVIVNFPLILPHSTMVNFQNYIMNGNLSISNLSGYSYSGHFLIGNESFYLQNGTYKYSFNYSSSNRTSYVNGSFNVSGNPININIGQSISFYLPLYSYVFIFINLIAIILVYLSTKNYISIIPVQALFFVSGYFIGILDYQLYFIVILILFVSLYVSIKVMARIGD